MSHAVQLVAADAGWPGQFAAIARQLRPCLPATAHIHHIGSTAVAGLVAKDVIDIQVTVADLDSLDSQQLAATGFIEKSARDHAPAGKARPAADLAKRFFKFAPRAANIHVRVTGRFNQRFALLCRDYLRAEPTAAAAYGQFKQRLALHPGAAAEDYAHIKDPVFDILVIAAAQWAEATGWQPAPPDA